MKKTVTLILVFIISQYKITAQSTTKTHESSNNEVLTRCFEDIPENKYLDSIGSSLAKKKKFCYLWTCLTQLSEENPQLNKAIYNRIKDIAEKLYAENKAVIITDNCENSIEEKNVNGKLIQIINTGICPGCIRFKEFEKGIDLFNNEIKYLFGISK
ncbi:hypothetical protein [Flavobacterium sp. ABG]|uniref:hypothetical protein n=1 Tax=Flavobacterium sp. ABG TaxID=1423322 RepID=UPI0006498FE7|nr:hypothetical protein [Flavobacterium sp. ABG]KLT70215.1 hypothetical protein AB674_08360 [Flavobacterium sp. ABG]